MKTNSLTYAAIAILISLCISSCTVDDDFCELESSALPASKERTVTDNTADSKDEITFKVKSDIDSRSGSEQNNMSKFKITAYEDGFNYYNGMTDEVSTSDNGLSWISDFNRYWPKNRPSNWKGLTFYAYAEGLGNNSTSEANQVLGNLDCNYEIPRIKNFKVNEDVSGQKCLMYAVATENLNKEVNLNFKNALSKVKFSAVNNDPNISNIEILSIQLGGVHGEGHFQFPDYAALANKSVVFESDRQGKWTFPEGCQAVSYTLKDINLNLGSAGNSNSGTIQGEMYLIPQKMEELKDKASTKGGFIKVTAKITSKGSSTPNAAKEIILPVSINWQEGKTYNYDINWTSTFTIVSCRESNF